MIEVFLLKIELYIDSINLTDVKNKITFPFKQRKAKILTISGDSSKYKISQLKATVKTMLSTFSYRIKILCNSFNKAQCNCFNKN